MLTKRKWYMEIISVFLFCVWINTHHSTVNTGSKYYTRKLQPIFKHHIIFLAYAWRAYEQYHCAFDIFDSNGDVILCPVEELQRCVIFASIGRWPRKRRRLRWHWWIPMKIGYSAWRISWRYYKVRENSDLKEAFKMYVEVEGRGCITFTPKSVKIMHSWLGERRYICGPFGAE